MAKRKTRRRVRYDALRGWHFLHLEAREFSKLTKKYPAMKRLIASRKALWAVFKRESYRRGWDTEAEREYQWNKMVVRFYARLRIKHKRDRDTGVTVEVLTNWLLLGHN